MYFFAVNKISLTTDFGTRDWFVGTMKGIILGIAPQAIVVDLTHEVSPGDICGGAFALAAGCQFFPKRTVHLAVADPGVGSVRKAIAVQTADYFFVGPDNGVLSFALARERINAIHQLANDEFFRPSVSRTFHGRDVFAPVAAHLSRGVAIEKLGPALTDFVRLDWPQPEVRAGVVRGEVVYVDRFGNLITNLDAASVAGFGAKPCEVFARRKRLCPVAPFYGAVDVGRPLAVVGSTGFLEIAVNGASAADKFGMGVGVQISVRACVNSR
jgi:S-adenosylmethionine hydrolase